MSVQRLDKNLVGSISAKIPIVHFYYISFVDIRKRQTIFNFLSAVHGGVEYKNFNYKKLLSSDIGKIFLHNFAKRDNRKAKLKISRVQEILFAYINPNIRVSEPERII